MASMGPRRRPGSGATLRAGFLVATVGLAAWLGYQAVTTAASHERTVEAALADYAGISAWELARAARSEVDEMLGEAFRPVRRRLRGELPPPEVVGWDLLDAAREEGCRCRAFADPLALFRVETAPPRVTAVPTGLDSRTLRALGQLVLGQDIGRRTNAVVTVAAGELFPEATAVGFMVLRDDAGRVETAYGFAVPAEALGEFLAEVYDDRRLLPEPLAGGRPNDELLHVRIRDGSGLVLFQAPAAEPTVWAASEPMGEDFGSLVVEATVRPEAAASLIIGGLPRSRVPLLVLLLVLTLGVGAAALVQLRREQRFQHLRDDFVSGVSHELRTPLAQIQMFAELQEAGKLTTEEERKRAIGIIRRESRRLGNLVENILQFSRLRRTPVPVTPPERLELADGIADGVDAVAPLLEDRGMTLELTSERGLEVRVGREALTRIVVNLLDNAVKYGPAGQTVSVGLARRDGSARLTVTDEGPGVPPGDRARVWKPYRRLGRGVESETPGTGIGLSVVWDLVTLHGGEAWVESAPEAGATFVVELPLADATRPGGDSESGP